MTRCAWAHREPLIAYHDTEWGVPLHEDHKLFEFMVLDAMQAGLSWEIVLKKRDAFRKAFDDFDVHRVARYNQRRVQKLLNDPGIVRNRLKVNAAVANAKAFLTVQKEFGTFDQYIWRFTGHGTIENTWRTMTDLPAATDESRAMSKDLLRRDFRFVGPTICYAFMQAAGMVNDHLIGCPRHEVCRRLARAARPR